MQLWIMLVPRIVVMTVAIIWSNFLIVDHFIIEVILKIFVLFCRAKPCGVVFCRAKALRCNVFFSYFLRREERSKEASTPPNLPYMGGLTRKIAVPDNFSPFWYRGTRDNFFIGWRMDIALFPCQVEPLSKGRRKQGCRRSWRTP